MSDLARWQENKKIYSHLVKKIEFEEKLWLLECNGDYDIYEKRLRFLAKKYAVLNSKK